MPELTCREFVAFLDDYISNGQPSETRLIFERHLAECPQCVRFLNNYRDTVRLVRDSEKMEQAVLDAPPEIIAAILAARNP